MQTNHYCGIVALGCVFLMASSAMAVNNVEVILDASGSMAAKIGDRTKMDIAKKALFDLVLSFPDTTNIAIRLYGHRRKDDCNDIELVTRFDDVRIASFADINALKGLGKTPLSASITAAAKDFAGKEGQDNTVILITDGEETCQADPCVAAKVAHASGVKVKINVIGFKIGAKERAQLECIAQAGGGKYVSAENAEELAKATKEVAPVPLQPQPAATAKPADDNILATANGGQLLVAPGDEWSKTNDGKEEGVDLRVGQEAIYGFKDEQAATFDRFSTLVPAADDKNLKEFELLAGDDSPTGTFRSIGTFTAQNAKMLKSPYQEFKFEPVTAKYLKIRLLSNYGAYQRAVAYEFKVPGKTNVPTTDGGAKAPAAKTEMPNILAQSNGGQVLMAPGDEWSKTNDGKEDGADLLVGQEAVYAFKDEQPATFARFATLVPQSADKNLKEVELLAGDDSPTGTFRSIGTFTVQNAKMLKSPYQEFKFDPVTAKYLKIKLVSNHGAYQHVDVYEFKVFGSSNAGSSGDSAAQKATETKSAAAETKSTGAGQAKPESPNIVAESAGGQVLVAPNDEWSKLIDGKENLFEVVLGQEGVFAFKDEQPASFDRVSFLVNQASDNNLKEFELLAGDESPTGTFRSIGTFTAQNAKMLKSPYQEFKFAPVTAKYLKLKVISNYGAYLRAHLAEFRVSAAPK